MCGEVCRRLLSQLLVFNAQQTGIVGWSDENGGLVFTLVSGRMSVQRSLPGLARCPMPLNSASRFVGSFRDLDLQTKPQG